MNSFKTSRAYLGLLAAAILVVAGMLAPASAMANGCITNDPTHDGTAAHPFEIGTLNNLICLRGNAPDYWAGKYFVQTADIDLSGEAVWGNTIGNAATAFTGHYDGNGHRITGLRVDLTGTYGTPANFAGLFGRISGGSVSNLTINDATIAITPTGSRYGAGILAGKTMGGTTITNVHTSGTVSGQEAGGLVGETASGTTIGSSSSSATITGNDWCAAGLVGCAVGPLTVSDSRATGQVTGDIFVGGLVGAIWQTGLIERSYATGTVTGRPAAPGSNGCCSGFVGGLVGLVASESGGRTAIRESFATGDVTQTDSVPPLDPNLCGACVGGLVGVLLTGAASPDGEISDSYASGTVTGGISTGGLVGSSRAGSPEITRSYSRSPLRGAATATFGGIIGAARNGAPSVSATFWNPTAADHSTTASFGTQSTQAAMTTPALYSGAGWQIGDVLPTTNRWVSCPSRNDGYPFLGWYAAAQSWDCSAVAPPASPGSGSQDPGSGSSPPASGSGAATPVAAPSNAFTIGATSLRDLTIRTRISVPGAGRLTQRATGYRRSGAAARLQVCSASKTATEPGVYTLTCRGSSAARTASRRGPIRVSVQTTFKPVGGTPRSVTRKLVLPSLKPRYTG